MYRGIKSTLPGVHAHSHVTWTGITQPWTAVSALLILIGLAWQILGKDLLAHSFIKRHLHITNVIAVVRNCTAALPRLVYGEMDPVTLKLRAWWQRECSTCVTQHSGDTRRESQLFFSHHSLYFSFHFDPALVFNDPFHNFRIIVFISCKHQ